MSIISYFKKVDFMCPYIGFENENSNKFQTNIGALLSLIIFVASLTIAVMFGREIYQRKIPYVSESKEFVKSSKIYLKDFSPTFTFAYLTADLMNNPFDYYDYSIESLHFDSTTGSLTMKNDYVLVECKTLKFAKNEIYMSDILKAPFNFYCIKFTENDYFSNDFSTLDSVAIRITFRLCDLNDLNRNCKLNEEIYKKTPLIVITYLNAYVNPNSFESPVLYNPERFTQTISPELFKLVILGFTNNIIVSDHGWMLEDKRSIEYIGLKDYSRDINQINDSRNVVTFTFESPRLRTKTNRNYMKIQELFAKVGGIVNAFIIIFSFLCQDYIKFLYYKFVRENSFDLIRTQSSYLDKLNANKNCYNNKTSFETKLKKYIMQSNQAIESSSTFIKPQVNNAIIKENVNPPNNYEFPNLNHIEDNLKNSSILNLNNNSNFLYKERINQENSNLQLNNRVDNLKININQNQNEELNCNRKNKSTNNYNIIPKSKTMIIENTYLNEKDQIRRSTHKNLGSLITNDLFKDFEKDNEISYYTYICMRIFRCSQSKDYLNKNLSFIERIKKLVDVKVLFSFLIENYSKMCDINKEIPI